MDLMLPLRLVLASSLPKLLHPESLKRAATAAAGCCVSVSLRADVFTLMTSSWALVWAGLGSQFVCQLIGALPFSQRDKAMRRPGLRQGC